MEHQDWQPLIMRPKITSHNKAATNGALRTGNFETVKKVQHDGINKLKIANETETFVHEKVSTALAKAIVEARLAKNMSRADLARAMNEHTKVIDDYETKKAIPDPKILNKMARILGVKLNKNM